MNGKGDAPRPLSVDVPTYHTNWERIFGKDTTACQYSGLLNTEEYMPDPVYLNEVQSGMFFEWYPELSGTWEKDQLRWTLLKLSRKHRSKYDVTSE
jgi:hypothetical protein